MYQIIKHKNIWLGLAGSITLVGLILFLVFGLKPGIDFTGGSLQELSFAGERPSIEVLKEALAPMNFSTSPVIQPAGEANMLIRTPEIDEDGHQTMLHLLKEKFGDTVHEERFESVGSSIGKELKTKALYSVLLSLIAIILYVAYAFRGVSWPVASWKYGLIAIIALIHDIVLVLGVFAILGKAMNVEIDLPFIAALLTILGYSVNDTIVVFDRVRENLGRVTKASFEEIVNRSVNETLARSINTSLTTLLPLLAIFFWGGASIKFFALALLIGIFSGAYSSIFIASPLLVVFEKLAKKSE